METKKLAIGSTGTVILAWCVYRCVCIVLDVGLHTTESYILAICEVILLFVLSAIACILVHMSLVLWSDHHTLSSIVLLYALNMMFIMGSKYITRKLEKITKFFRETQQILLLEGLKYNAKTAYGEDFNFDTIHSLDDFKAKHPLTTYEHYQKYIDRICNGEENVMTKDKTYRLTLTSGTTGKSKKIPYTKSSLTDIHNSSFYQYIAIYNDKRFTLPSPLQKNMLLMCAPITRPKIAGIPVGPVAMIDPSHKKILTITTTPPDGFDICTEFESCYVHMLFGICDRYLYTIESPFSSLLLQAFHVLKQNWRQILDNIESGRLSPNLNIPTEIRQEIDQHIKVRNVPARIQFLRREFENGFEGIVKRIWPKVQYVAAINIGTSGEELNKTYTKGIPLITVGYAGTEGFFGVNMSLTPPLRYTLLPTGVIFEFIPVQESGNESPDAVFSDAVKVGEQYEMVVTNPTCGLYRFRFGDVIKVVDFNHEAPIVEFQYRYGEILNLRGEKVDEAAVFESIMNCVKRWSGLRLVEFSSAESTLMPDSESQTGPAHYVIFIEVEGKEGEYVLSTEQKSMVDLALCEQACLYKAYREDNNSIGPMDVRQVMPGGFAELKKYIIGHSTTSVSQFKQPRKLRTVEMLECILQHSFKN